MKKPVKKIKKKPELKKAVKKAPPQAQFKKVQIKATEQKTENMPAVGLHGHLRIG